MNIPSIKGVLLIPVVQTIGDALATHQLDRQEVELFLEAPDIELLDEKLDAAAWYPVASYGRMNELMARELVGGDRSEALRTIGRERARNMRDIGTYSQITFEEGVLEQATPEQSSAFARFTATLHTMLHNYGTTRVEIGVEPGCLYTHYEYMTGYPDAIRLINEGFSETMSSWATGRPCIADSIDITEDRYTLRIRLS